MKHLSLHPSKPVANLSTDTCNCVTCSADAWPWGAYLPEGKAAPARSAASGKRARAVPQAKPGVKRGRGAIASAPPARGRGRAPKRTALSAISEDESAAPAKRRPRLKAADDGHTAAEGGHSPQHSSQGGTMVYVDDIMSSHSDGDEHGDAAAPEPHWQHRPSAAGKSRIVLEDDEDTDHTGVPPGVSQDHGDDTDQPAPAPAAAPSQDSLLGRLLSQPLSKTLSLPTSSQHSDGAPLSPARRPHAPAAQVADPGAAQEAQTAQQQTAAVENAGAHGPNTYEATTAPTLAKPPMSLRQRLAELKAMRARNAGAA